MRSLTGPRIKVRGDTVCSFFSAMRRTNQEAPPLLSGFFGRRLALPSGAAELAALKQSSPSLLGRLASFRPDKGGASVPRRSRLVMLYLMRRFGHTAPRRGIQEYPFMSFRTVMRNPEILGGVLTNNISIENVGISGAVVSENFVCNEIGMFFILNKSLFLNMIGEKVAECRFENFIFICLGSLISLFLRR